MTAAALAIEAERNNEQAIRLDFIEYWLFWNPFFDSSDFPAVNAYLNIAPDAEYSHISDSHWYCQALNDDLAELASQGRLIRHSSHRVGSRGHVAHYYVLSKERDNALLLDPRPRPVVTFDREK